MLFKLEGTKCELGNLGVPVRSQVGRNKVASKVTTTGRLYIKCSCARSPYSEESMYFAHPSAVTFFKTKNKRKKKPHCCGILLLSDVGSKVSRAGINSSSSRSNKPAMATQPFVHDTQGYLLCIFPSFSERWRWRRVVCDTVVVLFLFSTKH